MLNKIIVAGFGGQGIIVGAKMLAVTLMRDGKEVTHFPSYGAEMRGGTCNCFVVTSDKPVASPMVKIADIAMIFNKPSKAKFEPNVKKGGIMILNKSLIDEKASRDDITTYYVDATNIADKLGASKSTNMVMFGAFAKATGLVSLESLIGALKYTFPKMTDQQYELNVAALKAGYEDAKTE
jgi:2-oxoglutarate ferredoxin oxidoreductase subunit gamma